MYTVCVKRVSPYVEDLYYDFDNLSEANEYAFDIAQLYGVDEAVIFDEDAEEIIAAFS